MSAEDIGQDSWTFDFGLILSSCYGLTMEKAYCLWAYDIWSLYEKNILYVSFYVFQATTYTQGYFLPSCMQMEL